MEGAIPGDRAAGDLFHLRVVKLDIKALHFFQVILGLFQRQFDALFLRQSDEFLRRFHNQLLIDNESRRWMFAGLLIMKNKAMKLRRG